ncbi:uncharacterized protein TNIN_47101 [Trichonephila inaurata madagascariensis]|uniref:Uncharacterized protein n=1 Tax=Trichonephila inaurata madagascariensis TaxID=2747483 RepID=A0A8X6YGW5_9ARAC|nr:uncharacterized protein TNIN_47101 [Trichonephila inaurata madagascariensis]
MNIRFWPSLELVAQHLEAKNLKDIYKKNPLHKSHLVLQRPKIVVRNLNSYHEYHIQTTPLKHIALVGNALGILRTFDQQVINTNFLKLTEEVSGKCYSKVISKIKTLLHGRSKPSASCIEKEISGVIRSLAREVERWIYSHDQIVYYTEIDLSDLCWYSYGIIDRFETAQTLVRKENRNPATFCPGLQILLRRPRTDTGLIQPNLLRDYGPVIWSLISQYNFQNMLRFILEERIDKDWEGVDYEQHSFEIFGHAVPSDIPLKGLTFLR